MVDAPSDADKIRQRQLAKLGEPASPIAPSVARQNGQTSGAAQNTSQQDEAPQDQAENSKPEPFATSSISRPSVSTVTTQQTPQPRSQINIKPRTPLCRQVDPETRPRSRQGRPESIRSWEDRTLSNIFKITLSEDQRDKSQFYYLPGVRADLEAEGTPGRISLNMLDQAILEAASQTRNGKPLEYLLGCWKRVSKLWGSMRASSQENDPKFDIIKEVRSLCITYCIFAITMPELFGVEWSKRNPLSEHLLCDPDQDRGVCHDFLEEAVARFADDDSIKDALVQAMEQLSLDLSKMHVSDNYKPYVMALRNFVRYPALVEALTESPKFLPKGCDAPGIETATLLGPFFRISPLTKDAALGYFTGFRARDESFVRNSQHALRMTLQTHQDDLFDITHRIVRAGRCPRERMLDWFAFVVNKNHRRRATYVNEKLVSSDAFMINVTAILDRLSEPFIEPTFSKVEKVDVDYLRKSPRIDIRDEAKINADQKTSDEFYANQLGPRENHFTTEIFFLTLAAHHYGKDAANTKLSDLQRQIKHLENQVEQFEKERPKLSSNPAQLAPFEQAVKRYRDRIEEGHCVIRAMQGVLLDETAQKRFMQFMRFVIVWLLRLAAPGTEYPKQEIRLPLPEDPPQAFKCLPKYFLENIVDYFKFCAHTMPWVIIPTQCEELVTICTTFLQSSEYVKSPYLQAGLVTILFHGVSPFRGRSKGFLCDVLNTSDFAIKHLLHALMKFYIECESRASYIAFFDKFSIRYEIFKVMQCIWSNSVYRENLDKESKQNVDFVARFIHLMLNDVTFILDESFTAFRNIHRLQGELEKKPSTLTPEQKQENEKDLNTNQSRAKSYMQLTTEFVQMFKIFTEALPDAFTMPEIVQHLADMLDSNLDSLAGKKQSELKVRDQRQYGFDPAALLSDIMSIYLNLKDKSSFITAVARDERSYKPHSFESAVLILGRTSLKPPDELTAFKKLIATIAATREADKQAEEDLGDIPYEFLDPLMYTLMEDPVILPTSRTTIDWTTIRSHLLSNPVDPFNGVPLEIGDVIPDKELKKAIEKFKAEARGKDSLDSSQSLRLING